MKVIVTGATQSGEYGEAWGYALSVEKHDNWKLAQDGTILAVRWRGRTNAISPLVEAMVTTSNLLWADVEPDTFYRAEEVSTLPKPGQAVNPLSRYEEALIGEASGINAPAEIDAGPEV